MNILFLCTGNSCRSQMAEGWARLLKADSFDAYSAGVEKHGLNPLAVKAMAEAGVDISSQVSKSTDELPADVEFDYVVTVCNNAHEQCPFFPAKTKVIHVSFDDPPALAEDAKNENVAIAFAQQLWHNSLQFSTLRSIYAKALHRNGPRYVPKDFLHGRGLP